MPGLENSRPYHDQPGGWQSGGSLAWGVSKKLKVAQRADNQVLAYWMVKQEE
jgi:hypothetical protein